MATAKKTSSRSTAKKASRGSSGSTRTSSSGSGGATKKSASKNADAGASTDKAAGTTSGKKSSAPRKRTRAPQAEAPRRKGAQQLAAEASRQLLELTGKDAEGISGLRRSDDGWVVQVEVLELRRVPSTTDVLATYEVEVDSDGELQEYRRVHRYVRGVPGEDGR